MSIQEKGVANNPQNTNTVNRFFAWYSSINFLLRQILLFTLVIIGVHTYGFLSYIFFSEFGYNFTVFSAMIFQVIIIFVALSLFVEIVNRKYDKEMFDIRLKRLWRIIVFAIISFTTSLFFSYFSYCGRLNIQQYIHSRCAQVMFFSALGIFVFVLFSDFFLRRECKIIKKIIILFVFFLGFYLVWSILGLFLGIYQIEFAAIL
jgi:hypothetical protein